MFHQPRFLKHWWAAHEDDVFGAVVLLTVLLTGIGVGHRLWPPPAEVRLVQTGAWSLCHEDEAYLIQPTFHGLDADSMPKFTYDWQCEPVDNLYAAGFNAAIEKLMRGELKPVTTTGAQR